MKKTYTTPTTFELFKRFLLQQMISRQILNDTSSTKFSATLDNQNLNHPRHYLNAAYHAILEFFSETDSIIFDDFLTINKLTQNTLYKELILPGHENELFTNLMLDIGYCKYKTQINEDLLRIALERRKIGYCECKTQIN